MTRQKWGHSPFLAAPKNGNVPNNQRGFILLTVVVAITLLAAIAFVLGYQGASQTGIAAGEFERDQLRYVAEAGMAHAKSQLAQNTSCASYADLPATTFGNGSYSATITPSDASPVTITATGTLQSGAEQSLVSQPVQTYQPANNVTLQLGITPGKDTMIDSFYANANWGGLDDLIVRSKPSWIQQPLLEFDLTKIPPGVRIISAKLELKQRIVGTSGVIGVQRVTRSWEEGTGKGTGNANGATWNKYDGASTWAQPGGDFASTLYVTAATTSAKNGGWVAWDIRDLVEVWVSGQSPNYGLVLVGDGVVNNAEFESREAPDPTAAPKLTIGYACECGQVCVGSGSASNLLLVVVDPSNLNAQENAKKALIEAWGYKVNLIDDSANQGEFDAAIAANDIAYVAEDIETGQLGTKLREATIGVVIEEEKITDEFGISSGETTFTAASVEVTDNTHYITEPFSLGAVTFSSSAQPVGGRAGTLAPGLAVLALRPSSTTSMLDAIDTGGVLFDAGAAAGRRVKLPWGGNEFDINSLTADGLTIMRRSLEWAATTAPPLLPIAHWKLDDGTGTTAIDSEGGHDGTLTNGPSWVAGQLGDALNFDGSDDYVDLTSDAELDDLFVDGATVMAWIEPAGWGNNGYGRIFDKSSSSSATGNGWALRMNVDNGGLNFGQGFTGGRGWWRFAEGSISLGSWQHIAVAYDASSTANDPVVYLNGSPVAVTRVDTPSGAVLSDAAINLHLGNHASSAATFFDGKIDDARIYDSMLSAAEIANVATGGGGGGGGGGGTFRDEFNTAGSYAGNDGTLSWAGDWLEINETDGPNNGDELVKAAPVSGFLAQVQDNDGGGEGLQREADLSGHSTANLTFTYWRGGLDNADDYVTIDVSADGGSSWTEVGRLAGPASDAQTSPQSASFDISAHISPNTRIRFLTSPNMGSADRVYFDDIQIDVN